MSVNFDDGSSEYLSYAEALVTVTPLTFACWFKPDSLTVHKAIISICDSGGDVKYFLLWALSAASGQKIRADVRESGINNVAYSASTYSNNVWQHAGGVFRGGGLTVQAFLGGVGGPTDVMTAAPAGLDRTGIGCLYRASIGYYMSGCIAEVGIWAAALTSAEMAALAAGYAPSLVRPDKLRAYIPMRRGLASSDKHPIYNYEPLGDPLSFSENGTPETAAHPGIICPQGPQISSVVPISLPILPLAMHHYRNMRLA
jgi:hypothetical protein